MVRARGERGWAGEKRTVQAQAGLGLVGFVPGVERAFRGGLRMGGEQPLAFGRREGSFESAQHPRGERLEIASGQASGAEHGGDSRRPGGKLLDERGEAAAGGNARGCFLK